MITPLPSLLHRWVVLVIPPVPVADGKTRQLYASLKANHYTEGQTTDRLVARLAGGGEITSSMLFNVFESVAFDMFDRLRECREQFLKAGAPSVHLAGSGPTLFTLVGDKVLAEKIYQNLQQQGLESYLTNTLTAIDEVN
ncbi:putative 4-diphosphocytidyl-2-C-methyl-D-erythritol kinase [subsurface metagenome]